MVTKVLNEEDMKRSLNELMNVAELSDSFTTQIFGTGVTKTVEEETLLEWYNNFEENQKNIEGLITYYYISNPTLFQSFDLTRILSSLDFKITNIEVDSGYSSNVVNIRKTLKKIGHKQLTRDLVSQLMASGTVCGMWVGKGKDVYLYVFDDLEYVFPVDRRHSGKFAVYLDLQWLESMEETKRLKFFEIFSPHITEKDYNLYLDDTDANRYVELPEDRAVCLRTHTLFRNQRFGVPWGTQAIFDILHKDKLKNLEKSISNKAINSVAVLEVGEKDSNLYDFNNLGPTRRRQIFQGVKNALEKSSSNGVTVIAVPHWTKLSFPDVDVKGLDPNKFNTINQDLNASTSGVMGLLNGTANFSAGKLILDLVYKKVGELLEQIEDEVYQKLLNLLVPKGQAYNYGLEYDKTVPLSKSETIAILERLNTTFGFSLKELLDNVGIDFEGYIENTRSEHEDLNISEISRPYSNAYTQSGSATPNNTGGRPVVEDPDNESTIATKTNDGNSNPEPSEG